MKFFLKLVLLILLLGTTFIGGIVVGFVKKNEVLDAYENFYLKAENRVISDSITFDKNYKAKINYVISYDMLDSNFAKCSKLGLDTAEKLNKAIKDAFVEYITAYSDLNHVTSGKIFLKDFASKIKSFKENKIEFFFLKTSLHITFYDSDGKEKEAVQYTYTIF